MTKLRHDRLLFIGSTGSMPRSGAGYKKGGPTDGVTFRIGQQVKFPPFVVAERR